MEKLCLGCMKMKQDEPICEHCGFDERTENLSHQLPIGTLLQNQYLVGRVLGQGGFGITYIGWDQHLSIPVAIKEYFPGGVVQRHTRLSTKVSCVNGEAPDVFAKHRERFLKEARTLAQLADIPEIVQIKSFFAANDTAYIVMEYVQGITLKDRMKQLGRPMTEQEVLDVMKPVLSALQKVHDQGLIHRDISPDNIMLPESGGIKLIDFGTVRYMDDSGKSKSTETVLKPGFAPMEQYITRGKLGTWTDVYALCATFHYLLTGKVPEEAMARLDSDGTLPMLRNRQGLSLDLIRIQEKGMRVRIADRIQSVGELYNLLYGGQTLMPEAEDLTLPEEKQEKSRSGKKRKWLPVVVALGAVAIAAGLWLARPSRETPIVSRPVPESTIPRQTETEPAPLQKEELYQEAVTLAEGGEYARAAILYAKLGDYRDARARSFETWALVPNRQTISFYYYYDDASGRYYDMIHAIRKDGSVAADTTLSDSLTEDGWENYLTADYEGIVSIHGAIGLKYDGTLALPEGVYKFDNIRSWSDIAAIASYEYPMESFDYYLYVGLKTDGTVVATGSIPVSELKLDRWSDIQAIACEMNLVAGLKKDGTVVAAGKSAPDPKTLEGWTDIIDIAVGPGQILGLRADGTILAAGDNVNNVLNHVNGWEWEDVAALSDGPYGIKSDGTVVSGCAGGENNRGNVHGWNDLAAITCNQWQTAALKKDGTLLFTADGWGFYANAHTWKDILLPDQLIADPQTQYAYADTWEQEGDLARAAITFGTLGHYRDSYERSLKLWRNITPNKTVYAGDGSCVMIKADGTVVTPAVRDATQYAVSTWKDVVSVSAGYNYTAGLKADGTLVMTQFGPRLNNGEWTELIAIDAYMNGILGLKEDGTVKASGVNVGDWTDIVAVSYSEHAVGLKMDGTVVASGRNNYGQCDVENWTDIMAISTAPGLTVGLKSDGSVVVAGNWDLIQYDLMDLVAVEAAGDSKGSFLVGLKADGTVVAEGANHNGQCNVSDWTDIVSISANSGYVLGLKADGTIVTAGKGVNGETRSDQPSGIRIP